MTAVGVRVERLHCPIGACGWAYERESPPQTTHAVPPDGYPPLHDDPTTFQEAVANVAYATVLHDALQVEGVIREHLETHSLVEWFQEVMRLRSLAVPRDALGGLVKVARYVSLGRSGVDHQPDGAPYPDAEARFALGALHDAGVRLADARG